MSNRHEYREKQAGRLIPLLNGRTLTSLPVVFLLAMSCGCTGATRYYPINGRVVTSRDEIELSFLLPGETDLNNTYRPIAGAKAFLAYDEDGQKLVTGCEAKTDEKGLYRIETKDIRRSADGWYYLVIEKEGYEPIKRHMGPGFMSPYLHNTAVLKPLSEK